MTLEEMRGEVRTQSESISERRIRDEQINWWLFHGMKNFCLETECSQQGYDYTITEENGSWRTSYPLPGFEAELEGGETYPYSYNKYAGATFKKALRLYIDGELAQYTPIDRILDPTSDAPPTMGTDTQGEAISGNIFDGTGTDTDEQFWYIKYNKFWCPYPAVESAVTARLHYVWVPDRAFKTAIELATSSPSRMYISQRIPATWHDAIVVYGLYKMFDAVSGGEDGYLRKKLQYLREYQEMVKMAKQNFNNLAPVTQIRGNYY